MVWARAVSLAAVVLVVCAMTHNVVPVCAAAAVVRPIDGSDADLQLATQFRATVRIVAEQVDKVCGLLG